MTDITLCRHCDTRVIPSDTGACPSCGSDINSEPARTRTRISADEEQKLLSKYQTMLNGRRLVYAGIALDLFNTLASCLRENSHVAANLTVGIAFAAVMGLIAWYLTRSLNRLRATLEAVTTN